MAPADPFHVLLSLRSITLVRNSCCCVGMVLISGQITPGQYTLTRRDLLGVNKKEKEEEKKGQSVGVFVFYSSCDAIMRATVHR